MTMVKIFDIYGVEPELTLLGKSKHKSLFGVCLSFLTLLAVVGVTFLFGQDMFYRSNPRLVTQNIMNEKSTLIHPKNQDFSIFFRLLGPGQKLLKLEDTPFRVTLSFSASETDKEGKSKKIFSLSTKPKKCTETTVKNNVNLSTFSLEDYYCLDWDEVNLKFGSLFPFGGFFGEEQFSSFKIEVGNCFFDYETLEPQDCVTPTELANFVDTIGTVNFQVFHPSFSIDATVKEPLKRQFEAFIYNLNPRMRFLARNFFQIADFIDDKGVIMENIDEYRAFGLRSQQNEFVSYSLANAPKYMNIYRFVGFLGKNKIRFNRTFMKIQELTAMVGGFLKVITAIFQCIARFYGQFWMETGFVKKVNIAREKRNKLSLVPFVPNAVVNNSSIHSMNRTEAKKDSGTVSVWQYWKGVFFNKSTNHFMTARQEVMSRLDLSFLAHFFDSLEEYLAELTENSALKANKLKNVFHSNKVKA